MAPLKSIKPKASDARVKTLVEQATRILADLRESRPPSANLIRELENHISSSFPLHSSTALTGKAQELDALGTNLWNAAVALLRSDDSSDKVSREKQQRTKAGCHLKVFAFFLIDGAHLFSTHGTKNEERKIRCWKTGLKGARSCFDAAEPELASKALERIAAYASNVEDLWHKDGDQHENVELRLVDEFYLLRILHGWKTSRPALAEHFYSKISVSRLLAFELIEDAADLFMEIGRDQARQKAHEDAVRWLQRAHDLVTARECGTQSPESEELSLSIGSSLVKALLATASTEAKERATQLVSQLETSHGHSTRALIPLMRLSVIFATAPIPKAEAETAITRMVRSSLMTESHFNNIVHSIHRLHKAGGNACAIIEELITSRLISEMGASQESDDSVRDMLDKAVVMRIFFATSAPSTVQTAAASLRRLLDIVLQEGRRELTVKGTHAAQTLLWKASSAANEAMAAQWWTLLRHPLFRNAGAMNQGRVARKAMTAAIGNGDSAAAREVFFQMPPTSRDENLSRYIAFKLACQSGDQVLAAESLDVILRNCTVEKDVTFLYACTLEAQSSGDRHLAVAALQAIIDRRPNGVHMATLLRCTAKMLATELDSGDRDLDDVFEEVTRVFEAAAAQVKAICQGDEAQSRAEIQWWTKNAYNMSLKHCSDVHPARLVRMIVICLKFLDSYPNDGGIMHREDILRRKLNCLFLSVSASIVLGRSSENEEEALQWYLRARQYIADFRAVNATAAENEGNKPKLFEMLKFDLEGVLRLQSWEDLDGALQTCLDLGDVDRWDTLADLVIVIHDQTLGMGVETKTLAKIPQLLKKAIDFTWKKDKDLVKAARWLRLVFGMTIDSDDAMALGLLHQATFLAQKGRKRAEPFPVEELTWLATTAFNRSIDCLGAGDLHSCRKWADAAVDLARQADDNGGLHADLSGRRSRMGLENQ